MMKNTVPSKEEFLATKKHFIKCMKDLFDQNYSINSSKLNELVARSHYNFDNGYQSLVADWKRGADKKNINNDDSASLEDFTYANRVSEQAQISDDELFFFAKVYDDEPEVCLWPFNGRVETSCGLIRFSEYVHSPASFQMKDFYENKLFRKRVMSFDLDVLNKYYNIEWIMVGDGTPCKFEEKKMGQLNNEHYGVEYEAILNETGLSGVNDDTRVLFSLKQIPFHMEMSPTVFVFKMKKKFLA